MKEIQTYFQKVITAFKQQESWANLIENSDIVLFDKKIAWKIGYGDYSETPVSLDAKPKYNALKASLYAVAAEAISSHKLEKLLAKLSLKDICIILVYGFQTDNKNSPFYPGVREGDYKISQAILRMTLNQSENKFTNQECLNASAELKSLALKLRSTYYSENNFNIIQNPLQNNDAFTHNLLKGAINSIDKLSLFRAQEKLSSITKIINEKYSVADQRLKTARENVKTNKVYEKDIKVWNNFKKTVESNSYVKSNDKELESLFVYFLKIFGFRGIEIFDSEKGIDEETMVIFISQFINQLKALKDPQNYYLTSLKRVSCALPTAYKKLENLTYIESWLECGQQLLDTINKPFNQAKKPKKVYQLNEFPFFVIDQSDTKNQQLFNDNDAYINNLKERFSANIHHISMAQVVSFADNLNIKEMFATTTGIEDPPSAGYGGARNITWLVATAFHEALKSKKVTTFQQFSGLDVKVKKAFLKQVVTNKPQVMMGDDDLTLMPGCLHSKMALAEQYKNGYWKIKNIMIGRATTSIPGAAGDINRIISKLDDILIQSVGTASTFKTQAIGDGGMHLYSKTEAAGVLMHLGSCYDLPLPSEESQIDVFQKSVDYLGLSIHHPGDRFNKPEIRLPNLAKYLAKIRLSQTLLDIGRSASKVGHWSAPKNKLKGNPEYQTIGSIYTWIAKPSNKNKTQTEFLRRLFIAYLKGDTLYKSSPSATFQQLTNKINNNNSLSQERKIVLKAILDKYYLIWKDLNLANEYRKKLWEKFVALFRDDAHSNKRNAHWTQINGIIGDQAVLNENNLLLVDWLIVNNIDINPAINNMPQVLQQAQLDPKDFVSWQDSDITKLVHLTTISLGQGRFFKLIKNIVDIAESSHFVNAHQLSLFPSVENGLNIAFSDEPVMLNGMKVIFDEAVPVQPVNLIAKDKQAPRSRHHARMRR